MERSAATRAWSTVGAHATRRAVFFAGAPRLRPEPGVSDGGRKEYMHTKLGSLVNGASRASADDAPVDAATTLPAVVITQQLCEGDHRFKSYMLRTTQPATPPPPSAPAVRMRTASHRTDMLTAGRL